MLIPTAHASTRFYLSEKGKRLPFSLVAEGVRKVTALSRLIEFKWIVPGSVLFWDEPEVNLNPRWMDEITFRPGVDFRVFESQREVWIEVKSWSFKLIHDRIERRTARKDFTQKLLKDATDEFRNDIITKFSGTTSYLVWSGNTIPRAVLYIVFLEPPNRGGRALLGPFQDRLRNQFKNAQARPWGKRIAYRVVDISGYQHISPVIP